MPTWPDLAAFGRELKGFEVDLSESEIRKITRKMGKEGQVIADRYARGDLGGDRAFSGWKRGNPIPLDTVLRDGGDGATILSPTKRSAGPWTVADIGRNAGGGIGGRFQGPGANLKTGLTSRTETGSIRVRRRRARVRYNGVTRGKNTAKDATRQMDRKLPPIADREVLKIARKRFDVT